MRFLFLTCPCQHLLIFLFSHCSRLEVVFHYGITDSFCVSLIATRLSTLYGFVRHCVSLEKLPGYELHVHWCSGSVTSSKNMVATNAKWEKERGWWGDGLFYWETRSGALNEGSVTAMTCFAEPWFCLKHDYIKKKPFPAWSSKIQ
jgi:hypothetical protein